MQSLLAVIDAVYEAGSDFDRWGPALELLSDWIGAEDAGLGVAATGSIPWLVAPRTDPARLSTYANYRADDLVWQKLVERGPGNALADASVVVLDDLKHNAFQNEWSAPQGYNFRLGAALFDDAESQTVIILPCRRPIEQVQLERLDQLLPHLRRAIRFSIASAQTRGLQRSVEELPALADRPVLMLDCAGRILQANDAAERLLAAGVVSPGAIAQAARVLTEGRSAGEIAATALLPGWPGFQFLPLLPQGSPRLPGCPAFLFYGAAPSAAACVQMLQRRFGLTPAEAALAWEMRHGDGRKAASDRRGISYATARTHLSRVFEKMGISRQAELVRIIAASCSSVAR